MTDKTTKTAPDSRELRSFGLIFASLVVAIFALLLPWLLGHTIPLWPLWIAVPVAMLALLCPRGLLPLFRVWMKFGLVMGRINTVLILSLVFYLMVTPTGWLMRLLGKDPMARKLERSARSYRIPSSDHGRRHVEKPY